MYFGLGLLVAWIALETPIDNIGDCCSQSVHMFQHVLLNVVAPPLLLLGLSTRMAAWLVRRVPGLRALTEPVPAQVIAAAVMIAWHLPPLYDLTLRSEGVHIFEHLTFIAAGTFFWWPLLAATGAQSAWRLSDGLKLLYLLVGTLPQDGVALVLQFSRDLFYSHYAAQVPILEGWTPVIDQQVAGTVLMLVGKTSFLVAGLAIFFRWIREEEPAPAAG